MNLSKLLTSHVEEIAEFSKAERELSPLALSLLEGLHQDPGAPFHDSSNGQLRCARVIVKGEEHYKISQEIGILHNRKFPTKISLSEPKWRFNKSILVPKYNSTTDVYLGDHTIDLNWLRRII